MFLTGQQGVSEYQSLGGQAVRALSVEHQQQYQMYSMIRLAGAGSLVIGILVLGKSTLSSLLRSNSSPSHSTNSTSASTPVVDTQSKMIQEGEEVLHRATPSWSRWIIHILLGVLTSIYLIGLLMLVYVYLARANTEYIITSERVIKKSGIFSKSYEDYWISDIDNSWEDSSFLENLLNQSSIKFNTKYGKTVRLCALPNYGTLLSTLQRL